MQAQKARGQQEQAHHSWQPVGRGGALDFQCCQHALQAQEERGKQEQAHHSFQQAAYWIFSAVDMPCRPKKQGDSKSKPITLVVVAVHQALSAVNLSCRPKTQGDSKSKPITFAVGAAYLACHAGLPCRPKKQGDNKSKPITPVNPLVEAAY